MSLISVNLSVVVNKGGFTGVRPAIALRDVGGAGREKVRALVPNDLGRIQEVGIDEIVVEPATREARKAFAAAVAAAKSKKK